MAGRGKEECGSESKGRIYVESRIPQLLYFDFACFPVGGCVCVCTLFWEVVSPAVCVTRCFKLACSSPARRLGEVRGLLLAPNLQKEG